jgi:hypothetical protein
MVKKKKTTTRKRKAPSRSASKKVVVDKGPEYMIQVSDPKMLRKDLLESLREVIIFMQGYEKFRKIQEEKVSMFIDLKTIVKDLNSLIDGKLKKYLPKGKLKEVTAQRQRQLDIEEEDTNEPEIKPKPVMKPVMPMPVEEDKPKNDLHELESQLNDIEAQLRKIQ